MGVADIIGTDAGQDIDTVNSETGQVQNPYNGFDPGMSKLVYSIFSGLNVVLGIWLIIRKWHIDADKTSMTT